MAARWQACSFGTDVFDPSAYAVIGEDVNREASWIVTSFFQNDEFQPVRLGREDTFDGGLTGIREHLVECVCVMLTHVVAEIYQ
ncbi:MAG: hypothetical protein AAGF36_11125 [Pseudomonadota bacterium]